MKDIQLISSSFLVRFKVSNVPINHPLLGNSGEYCLERTRSSSLPEVSQKGCESLKVFLC